MKIAFNRLAVCCVALATLVFASSFISLAADSPVAKKNLKLAFVTNNAATFWTIAKAGTKEAQKELGNVEVDFRIPSTGGVAEQQRILNDMVAAGVDGIAVSPIDAGQPD